MKKHRSSRGKKRGSGDEVVPSDVRQACSRRLARRFRLRRVSVHRPRLQRALSWPHGLLHSSTTNLEESAMNFARQPQEADGRRRPARHRVGRGVNPRDAAGTQDHQANGRARHRRDAAGRHDWQSKPREGGSRRQAGLRLHQQFAGAATLHRRTRGCVGGENAAGPAALREMGHCVVWRRRRLVLLLRRLRRPRQAHVRARHGTHARTAVAPIGMGKDSRGVDLTSVDDLDERQAAAWMRQAAALPGFGGKKR